MRPDPTESQRLVHELVTGILGWRQELRERSAREVEAAHRHVGELDACPGFKEAIAKKMCTLIAELKEAVAEKDAHIGKLDDTVVAFKDAIGEKDAHIQKLDELS